jgi:hypothetical protein
MVTTVWGVDSQVRASDKFRGRSAWDIVCDELGRKPRFWGRYIRGTDQNVDAEEASFLFDRGCRVLPLVTFSGSSQVQGSFASGASKAGEAIASARALGIPGGVFIYADIEPLWRPSKDFILGWWDGMRQSMYGGYGGLYCNNHPINSFFNVPYRDALATYRKKHPAGAHKIFLWVQTPAVGGIDPSWPEEHTGDFARVWQFSLNRCTGYGTTGLVDLDLATEEGFNAMWARPHSVETAERVQTRRDSADGPNASTGDSAPSRARSADDGPVLTDKSN